MWCLEWVFCLPEFLFTYLIKFYVSRFCKMDGSTLEGHPIPILLSEEQHVFTLNEEALEKVLLQDHIKDRNAVVVSVAGAFRKGKSFILDFFLRYMNHMVSQTTMFCLFWYDNLKCNDLTSLTCIHFASRYIIGRSYVGYKLALKDFIPVVISFVCHYIVCVPFSCLLVDVMII